MDQIPSDGKNLRDTSGRCVVARDKDQKWDTSRFSGWATSILDVCLRPPEYHQCANAVFRRWREDGVTTLTKRPFYRATSAMLPVTWDLPRNPTKCNYIATGRANPIQLSHAAVTSVVKDHVYPSPLNTTLVRLHLENAMQPCSPNRIADADCLDHIQRLAVSLVKNFHWLPYEERLRRLGLHSLNCRRCYGGLIATRKVLFGGMVLDHGLFYILPVRQGLTGHSFKVP